ncbi:TPA: hypothetical protein ACYLIB_005613 [Burkholderia cenocepacia]|uniref:hypothetical protein n=1 Tax=Burkholderia cenocepacia TaxID=95486 RepID=UPI001B94A565|nr:hypothetical protein [Burkholderia cenocepacia]MBR8435740.1 hypothetical protein [Burkholderia cenocepacia]
MRQDQYERLQALSEKLTDVFLDEADPEGWPGAGVALATMDKATRGDRYWSKKNAAATVMLIGRVHSLVSVIQLASKGGEGAAAGAVSETEDELDAEVAAAEKEAERLLDQVQQRARKTEFDKRVHGKS